MWLAITSGCQIFMPALNFGKLNKSDTDLFFILDFRSNAGILIRNQKNLVRSTEIFLAII